jgi:hypothetical protein
VEIPNFEMKKKQLEELRNFYRPLERKDFMEHAHRYEREK